ncbi:MAG: 3-phytase [Sphingobacteriales bacterium SCN 48-20]|jgi:3-phytase|uniref:phytase n=1 Tax=Terrimonas ferruginea TaxID=249 RepID=UPI0008698550|nr:phytase [Terrimonas ferruginea]MBN8783157.1 phytase [Terrimonas ferruginea]ODT92644.1 MAG: 3-phytase [Sphingobacteriales bacterium SCN 48-20]OJW39784.1 MAG: 3-phytase [Sphingobacteriales bacterium 48-107]
MQQLINKIAGIAAIAVLAACNGAKKMPAADVVRPVVVTEKVVFDTDDPAIWINPADPAASLIVGTDKETNGGIYAFDLNGRIVRKVVGLQRPNNIDIAYGFLLAGKPVDIAVVTERETNKLRFFSLPDLTPLDNNIGIDVFAGEKQRDPMGVAFYTRPSDKATFVIAGRKTGPAEGYLWQYQLVDDKGRVALKKVREFGRYSGLKEIESIAVDNELGYVYYSDERYGVHKYIADPAANNNNELGVFGTTGFKSDHEGISIYKTGPATGYILVSNQQSNSFMIYPREGSKTNPHQHDLIAEVPVLANESDGSDVTSFSLNDKFPKGVFVAMSNGRVFHYYDWRDIAKRAGLE